MYKELRTTYLSKVERCMEEHQWREFCSTVAALCVDLKSLVDKHRSQGRPPRGNRTRQWRTCRGDRQNNTRQDGRRNRQNNTRQDGRRNRQSNRERNERRNNQQNRGQNGRGDTTRGTPMKMNQSMDRGVLEIENLETEFLVANAGYRIRSDYKLNTGETLNSVPRNYCNRRRPEKDAPYQWR